MNPYIHQECRGDSCHLCLLERGWNEGKKAAIKTAEADVRLRERYRLASQFEAASDGSVLLGTTRIPLDRDSEAMAKMTVMEIRDALITCEWEPGK